MTTLISLRASIDIPQNIQPLDENTASPNQQLDDSNIGNAPTCSLTSVYRPNTTTRSNTPLKQQPRWNTKKLTEQKKKKEPDNKKYKYSTERRQLYEGILILEDILEDELEVENGAQVEQIAINNDSLEPNGVTGTCPLIQTEDPYRIPQYAIVEPGYTHSGHPQLTSGSECTYSESHGMPHPVMQYRPQEQEHVLPYSSVNSYGDVLSYSKSVDAAYPVEQSASLDQHNSQTGGLLNIDRSARTYPGYSNETISVTQSAMLEQNFFSCHFRYVINEILDI